MSEQSEAKYSEANYAVLQTTRLLKYMDIISDISNYLYDNVWKEEVTKQDLHDGIKPIIAKSFKIIKGGEDDN